MAAPQVLPQTLLTQQQQQQQLLQLLRRDLNRLSDSNRVTRLQGARSILRVYEEEAAKRAAETDRAATSGDNQKSPQKDHTPQACPFSGVFLSSVYAPISVLCADEASESCRATALDLVQLVVKHFLSRREVILICMGSKDTGDNTYPWGGDCNSCPVGAAFFRGRAGAADGSYLSSSSTGHSEAVKSLVLVIAERLKDASGEVEKSEELRLINMQLLQYLLLQYAADPLVPNTSRCQPNQRQQSILSGEHGWNAREFADCLLSGVAGALKDKSPSNAIEACRLLSAISQKLQVSVLLQSCKPLLERLVGCLARPQRAVRWQATAACDALLGSISSCATVAEEDVAAAASHIRAAATAIRPLLQQEAAVENKLKMVQMLRRLVQEMSPRVLLRRKVLPNLLQLLLLLMGDADQKVAREAEEALLSLAPRCVSLSRKREQRREWRREKARSQSQKLSSEEDELTNDDTGSSDDLLEENEDDGPHKTSRIPLSPCEADDETSELYKSTGYCREAPTELAGLYLKELMADLLPRLTSWSADERLASLRALAALMPMSGFRLLHQLPHLLMQLYETCAIGEGRPPGNRQDEQHQWSPLLLLVQHAILREIKGENEASNDCNSTNVSEPWHRGGLQELGACSSLCNSLEAVELALQCAGQVALLLPPCCWLPVIATQLGLHKEAGLYIECKKQALAVAVADSSSSAPADGAEHKISNCSDLVSQDEKAFLQRFSGGYQFVVHALGLNSSKCHRSQQKPPSGAVIRSASSSVAHMCSSETKKQALLLLARILRGLKPHSEQRRMRQDQNEREHKGSGHATHRGVYGLGRKEVWLLVRIIEQMQSAECGRDNDEFMPFTAAPLLQLLHAARELCQVEAKSLFAAALLQQIDTRSHQDIAREAVACVCECTGEGPLKLYLAFLDDLIARELHGDFAREESASPPSPMMQARPSLPMLWSSNDPRRLLLLRALHGAQEAADAEEVSSAANCLRMRDLVKLLQRQGTAQEATAPVRGDILGACLALFSLRFFIPLARPYAGWLLEHLLVPNLRWRPGEANAKLRKGGEVIQVALLCVSQIIPTLSPSSIPPVPTPPQQTEEGHENPSNGDVNEMGTFGQLTPANERKAEFDAVSKETNENEVQAKPLIAALSLLSPLLVSCMDDDWNADVRSLSVGVVRQLFLDLHGAGEEHAALAQLAAATATPLQQRLDDARDDIRLAAAVALQAMLKQRPLIINRSAATEICKSLCICLDDRSELLAAAAEAALLAGPDDLKPVVLEELQTTEPSCLYPERYKQVRRKLLEISEP